MLSFCLRHRVVLRPSCRKSQAIHQPKISCEIHAEIWSNLKEISLLIHESSQALRKTWKNNLETWFPSFLMTKLRRRSPLFGRSRHNNIKLRSLSAQHSKFGPAKHGDSGFGEKPEVDQIWIHWSNQLDHPVIQWWCPPCSALAGGSRQIKPSWIISWKW